MFDIDLGGVKASLLACRELGAWISNLLRVSFLRCSMNVIERAAYVAAAPTKRALMFLSKLDTITAVS